MQTKIEVADRKEAEQIRRGLELPDVRVLVRVAGILAGLAPASQGRALNAVAALVGSEAPKE